MYPDPQGGFGRREYPMKAWKKMFGLMLGIVLCVGSYFVGMSTAFSPDRTIAVITALFFVAGGIYMLAWITRSSLVLDGTRIEVQTAFSNRSAERNDIEGFRTIQSRNGSYKQLQLKNGGGTITLRNDFDTDADFDTWFRHVPDLDQRDREALLNEIKQRQELGSTPDERMAALATAKTLAIFALIVAVAAAAVLNFADPLLQLPAGILLAATPLVVLFMIYRSPLLYAIFKPKADPRAELAFVLMVSSFAFLLRIAGVHMVSIKPLAPLMAVLAALFLIPVFLSNRGSVTLFGKAIALIFFAGLYGYSLIVTADALLDRGAISPYRATVTGMHESHGRSTSYTLTLAPWGPFENTNRVGVSGTVYGHTQIGDDICLNLHPGTLHAPWFQQVDCGAQPYPGSSR